MKVKDKYFGASTLFASSFIYGFFGILTRTLGFDLPLFFQSWTRNLFMSLILFIPVLYLKKWKSLRKKHTLWIIARALGGLLGFVGSFISFYYIPIGTAYFVFYSGSTIGGYLLGRLLFNEKFTVIKISSLILSIAGLFLIYTLEFEIEKSLYILAALSSGFGSAIWSVFSKKVSHTYSALQLNFLDFLLFFIMTFSLSVFLKEKWSMPSFSSPWIANLLFAAMFLSTGQLMIYGFKHLKAQTGSLIMLSEILFGITLAFLFYKEIPPISTFLGGIFIISAILLPALKFRSELKKLNQ